jgi:hypothetical protein
MESVRVYDLIKPPFCILAVGKPRSGKSHLCKFLTYYFCASSDVPEKDRPQWVKVFTGSRFNSDYAFLPDKSVSEYTRDSFEEYVDRMTELAEEAKSKNQKMPQNILILDDLVGLLSASDELFNSFISRHRHYGTNVLIAVQYLKKNISTTVRECITHAFMFKSKKAITTQALHEAFGQDFDYESFKQLLWTRASNEEHVAMLYIESEDDPNENYLRFKAPSKLPDRSIRF